MRQCENIFVFIDLTKSIGSDLGGHIPGPPQTPPMITGSHYFSFFELSNLLTQTCLRFCMIGSSEQEKFIVIVYYYICLPLCHILYFDAATFSIKLKKILKNVFIYIFSVSIFRQWDEYEIVTETRPIKTNAALTSKTLICTKILIYNQAVV